VGVPRVVLPYPLPPEGAPLRVAFVGQRTYFETSAMDGPTAGIQPCFFDFRGGTEIAPLLDGLARFAPHVVVCFRPESLPPGALAGVRAPVVGFVTEALPRAGRTSHPSLDYNLQELRRVDRGNVDRAICADPLGWDAAAELLPTWRSMPLPVADRLYRQPTPSRHPPRIVFVGHASWHREDTLIGLKHKFDLPHYAHALMGDQLQAMLAGSDVGISLHNDRWLVTFDRNVLVHMAGGHLVLAEPLDPTFGLDPGIHYVEVADKYELDLRVHQLVAQPDAYERIRIRGHHFSRQFRASQVWPRVVADLLADLAAFGTDRVVEPGRRAA
jgi:hypothetical protein